MRAGNKIRSRDKATPHPKRTWYKEELLNPDSISISNKEGRCQWDHSFTVRSFLFQSYKKTKLVFMTFFLKGICLCLALMDILTIEAKKENEGCEEKVRFFCLCHNIQVLKRTISQLFNHILIHIHAENFGFYFSTWEL